MAMYRLSQIVLSVFQLHMDSETEEQGRGTEQISVINTTAQRSLWGEGRKWFQWGRGARSRKEQCQTNTWKSTPCRRELPNCMLVSAHRRKYSSRSWMAIARDQEEEVKSAALPPCSAPARGLGCRCGEQALCSWRCDRNLLRPRLCFSIQVSFLIYFPGKFIFHQLLKPF